MEYSKTYWKIEDLFSAQSFSDSLVLTVRRDTERPPAFENIVRILVVQDQGAALFHLNNG